MRILVTKLGDELLKIMAEENLTETKEQKLKSQFKSVTEKNKTVSSRWQQYQMNSIDVDQLPRSDKFENFNETPKEKMIQQKREVDDKRNEELA